MSPRPLASLVLRTSWLRKHALLRSAIQCSIIPQSHFTSTAHSSFPRQSSAASTPSAQPTKPTKPKPPTHSPSGPGHKLPAHRLNKLSIHRLRHLSGSEKLELLQSCIREKQLTEAKTVYTVLKENDLVMRLKYGDYHGLFHLCLSDAFRERDTILDVVATLRRFKYNPTPNMLIELLGCCVKWRDLELGTKVYEEMKARDIKIDIRVCNAMLKLCLRTHISHGGTAQLLKGVELWNEMVDNGVRMDVDTFCLGLELFGRVGNVEGVKDVYKMALTKLGPKTTSVYEKPSTKKLSEILNAYLAALLHAKSYTEAQAVYTSLTSPGGLLAGDHILVSRKSLLHTYSILIKLAYLLQNPTLAEKYWNEATRRGVQPDVVIYGRMIGVFGRAGDMRKCKEWFELGVERLGLYGDSNARGEDSKGVRDTKRLNQLRTSLLTAYADAGHVTEAKELYNVIRSEHEGNVLKSTVRALVSALRKAGDELGAEDVLRECGTQEEHGRAVENVGEIQV